jgi:hypothetical protein
MAGPHGRCRMGALWVALTEIEGACLPKSRRDQREHHRQVLAPRPRPLEPGARDNAHWDQAGTGSPRSGICLDPLVRRKPTAQQHSVPGHSADGEFGAVTNARPAERAAAEVA